MKERGQPPYRRAGLVTLLLMVAIVGLVYGQFLGAFTTRTQLTLHADRAGLVMEPGAKVTFNGVEIGRVDTVSPDNSGGTTTAALRLAIDPRYATMIPANANVDITASTVFGNKYVSFTSPKEPSQEHLSPTDVIDIRGVSTEFNTLFETIVSISEKVDPVRLNATLSAVAEGLTGLGSRFGSSLVEGNQILDELNPKLPELRREVRALTDLADVYTAASPDLWQSLAGAVTTARALNEQHAALDSALLASVGFGNTAADVFERGGPYLARGAGDLVPTTATFDHNSPSLFCTIRNYAQVAPLVADALGTNGYSLSSVGGGGVIGAEPPYIYPDNLPRVNASGGPGGKPGCWQPITRQLWPAPYLVMDTGASIAPYNHLEIGQPLLTDYVWGRQVGEYTINP